MLKKSFLIAVVFNMFALVAQDDGAIGPIRMTSARMGKGPVLVSLFRAAQEGNVDLIKMALARGENVNAVDGQGNTALYYAIVKNSLPAVKALMEAGARINKPSFGSFNASPVHIAVRMHGLDSELVQYLMSKGASLYI
ncbi:MAG: ankyrin repeat domain-containing protein [Candidatus Babeliaceae bacterium]|jgi:ankyrin repeat protein